MIFLFHSNLAVANLTLTFPLLIFNKENSVKSVKNHIYLANLSVFLYPPPCFSSFSTSLKGKEAQMLKRFVLTSEQSTKYLLTGQNTKQVCSGLCVRIGAYA